MNKNISLGLMILAVVLSGAVLGLHVFKYVAFSDVGASLHELREMKKTCESALPRNVVCVAAYVPQQ
jgi:hypothetical protein